MEDDLSGLRKTGWINERGEPDYHLNIEQFPAVHAWWRDWLAQEMQKPYFKKLCQKIAASHEELESMAIYPPKHQVFRAFEIGEPRVVILGQDPYISEGQAVGLSFSVPPAETRPRSLINVYKELLRDPAIPAFSGTPPKHGDLESWWRQGVLLLNTALTVREGKSASHLSFGWKEFTRHAIEHINTNAENPVVFMLWGRNAEAYKEHISEEKHHVLIAGHPSPLNRTNPFVGCGHFSKANELLGPERAIKWESIKA